MRNPKLRSTHKSLLHWYDGDDVRPFVSSRPNPPNSCPEMPRTGAWLLSNPVRISIHVSPDMKESTRSKILSEQNHHEYGYNPWLILSPVDPLHQPIGLSSALPCHDSTPYSHESLYHGGQTKPTTQTLDHDLFIRHHGEGEYKVFANPVNSTPGQPANHARRPGSRGYQAPASHPLGMWVNSNCPLTAPTQDGPWSFCRLQTQHTSAFPHVWRSDEYEWLSVDRVSKQRSSNWQASKAVCISMLATDSGVFLARLMHFASSRHLSNVMLWAYLLVVELAELPDITAHGRSWARDVEHDGQGSAHSFKCLWVVVPVLGAHWPPYHPPSREPFADHFSSAPKANTSAGRCPPWHSTVYYALVMPRKPMSSFEIFSQSESIASPYAQSLNLGSPRIVATQGPARIVTFSETVWSVWYGHISGLPVLGL
ncbi:hypothetical protein Landi51_03573 [Colletotrichum acutatum]